MVDIHGFDKQIKRARDVFLKNKSISQPNKDVIIGFFDEYGAPHEANWQPATRQKNWSSVARILGGPQTKPLVEWDLTNPTLQDIKDFLKDLWDKKDPRKYDTKATDEKFMKTFYRWYKKSNYKIWRANDDLKEAAEWLFDHKLPKRNDYKNMASADEDEMKSLTKAEVKMALNSCNDKKQKAFMAFACEVGPRISEALNIQLKHIDKTTWKHGWIIHITNSKTKYGIRKVYLRWSMPFLSDYLNEHPFQDNPEAWLFLDVYNNQWGYDAVRMFLAKLSKRMQAGGKFKKHITPHVLRKTAATLKGNEGYSEYELQDMFGWSRKSNVAHHYVKKLDIKKAIERKEGLETEEHEAQKLKIKKCMVCGHPNKATASDCEQCRRILDPKEAIDRATELDDIKKAVAEVLQDPTRLMQLIELNNLIKSQGKTQDVLKILSQ